MKEQRCQWRQRWWVGMLSTVMLAGAAHAADHDSRYVLPDQNGVAGYIVKGAQGTVWVKNQVYYEFDPSIKPETRASLQKAMSQIEALTPVRFIRDSTQPFRLNIIDGSPAHRGDSCGMSYHGRQRAALQPQPLEVGCTGTRTALQLLMLAMGVESNGISALPPAAPGNDLTAGEIDAIHALYPKANGSLLQGTAQSYQLKNKQSALCLAADPASQKQFMRSCSGYRFSYDYWPVMLQQCESSQNRQQWHYLSDGRLKNLASPDLCLGAHNTAMEGQRNRDLVAVSCASNQVLRVTETEAMVVVRNTGDLVLRADAGRAALDILPRVMDRTETDWSWVARSGSTPAVRPVSPASPFGETAAKGAAGKGSAAVRIPVETRRAVAITPTVTWSAVARRPAGSGHAVVSAPAGNEAPVGGAVTRRSPERLVQAPPVPGAAARQLVSAVNGQCLTVLASRFDLKPLAMQPCRSGEANQQWRQAGDGKIRSEAYPGACLGRLSHHQKAGTAALVSCEGPSVPSWRDAAGRLQDVSLPTIGLSNIHGMLWIDEVFAANPAWSQWKWQRQ